MSLSAIPVIEVRLPGLALAFSAGRLHVLRGAEGSGREALFRRLGLLDLPDSAEVLLEGCAVRALAEEARGELRNRRIGFVFAAPFLLPAFTVVENVAMPLFKVSAVDPAEARQRTDQLLDFVGLSSSAQCVCEGLSPREQHLAALARALVNEPALLLVENPEAALHGEELREFGALLRAASARFGVAVIATVSPEFPVEKEDRVVELDAGAVRCDSAVPLPSIP